MIDVSSMGKVHVGKCLLEDIIRCRNYHMEGFVNFQPSDLA